MTDKQLPKEQLELNALHDEIRNRLAQEHNWAEQERHWRAMDEHRTEQEKQWQKQDLFWKWTIFLGLVAIGANALATFLKG